MYSECISLSDNIRKQDSSNNVLSSFSKFSTETGHEVVLSVLKPLEKLVRGKSDAPFLSTAQQVDWTMEVIGYGLTLPLSDKHLLQGCVDVYRDWLTALYFKKRTVPQPLIDDANRYASLIFSHLCALFVPRDEPRLIEDHAELCSKVLEMVQALTGVKKGLKITRDTWEAMFTFLLYICDTLLAPPIATPSLGTSLCELLIHVLFTSWLRACQDCFPSPNMWKTLREFCCNWRHHYNVIDQWNKLMYSITCKVVSNLYGPKHLSKISPLPIQDQDFRTLLESMSDDAVVQCWFRLLHTLGNPVDLLYPEIITSGEAFRRLSAPDIDLFPSTSVLPNIFRTVMEGVSMQVSLFLGQRLPNSSTGNHPTHRISTVSNTVTGGSPSMRRKDNPSRSQFYVPPPPPSHAPAGKKDSFYINITPDKKSPLGVGPESYNTRHGIVGKPSGNTLLHIFGNWLFEAAVWEGQDQEGFPLRRKSHSSTTVISSAADVTKLKDGNQTNTQQRLKDYELGRAEAFGALSTIFCHMPCGEDVMKVYLARFYHSMFIGLKYNPLACSGHVLTRIILTSDNLLRKDLSGANVLVLPFLNALEETLRPKNSQFKPNASIDELRRASILLLLSILPLPLHFIHLNIPDISYAIHSDLSPKPGSKTFYSLRNRVLKLLFTALDTEKNATNIQMLLHGVMVYLQDLTTYEQSVSKMIGEGSKVAAGGESGPETYKEDISLSVIFRQAVVSAHSALVNHSRDNTVTLASLELLTGLARLQFDSHTHVDCRDAVQWVCEFIEAQAQEKPYLQTKSLHTSIVAAFKTLMVWVMEHPHLLAHESCLSWILRVTEFGITGSFSMDEDGSITHKGEKTAHPVSGRVKEIAEFMLYCVMEKFGSFPSPCGAAASGSLLTEEEIIKRLKKSSQGKFKHYLVDNAMIIGLLEGTFIEEGEKVSSSLPTVTAIIRGPAGRQVWSLQMRQYPKSYNPSDSHLNSRPRPKPLNDPPACPLLKRPPWPSEVDEEIMKQNKAIPELDDILNDPNSLGLHRKICQLLQDENCSKDGEVSANSSKAALEPPKVKETFDTVRLFLNHFGLLNINNVKPKRSGSPSISILDSSSLNFRSSLAVLDRMPTRYCDSVFVIYCKKGQKRVEDILSHQQNLHSKPPEYMEFLHGLGWVVDPVKHPGFSGKLRPEQDEGFRSSIGLSVQIPYSSFPYYADAISEIAFIQPALRQSTSNSTSSIRSVESSDSGPETVSGGSELIPGPSSTHQLPLSVPSWSIGPPTGSGVQESSAQADIDHSMRGHKTSVVSSTVTDVDTPRRRTATPQDCSAIVVWLECFEDRVHFPLETMTKLLHKGYCKTSKNILPTVFVHKLKSGLFQIATPSNSSLPPCGPLIDGMVVSRRCLGALTRATVANLCFSYRLDNEGYSPPHVKRKRKIEDIGSQFSKHRSVPELFTDLITN